jgi:serine/threonine-protein kinase
MLRARDLVGCALDDRYELLRSIGDGAFGWVYEGRDRRLDRAVAVKLIKPWWADDGAWVKRFEREAQMLARVNDPGIVQIFDFGHADQGPYYVAELVPGESLAQRLRREMLPVAEARRIGEELTRALGSAHARGVVHCDVKPANVLITPDATIKVGDFGVARLAEATSQALSGTVAGTPRYMSPEQARGEPATPATDVYSAGVVLYEMLAGEPPFAAKSAVELALRHIQEPPPKLPATVPVALREVVEKALAKPPARRFCDGADMAAALRACAQRNGSATGIAVTRRAAQSGELDASADAAAAATAPTLGFAPAPTVAAVTRRLPTAPTPRPRTTRPRRTPAPARRRFVGLVGVLLLACAALAVWLLAGAGAKTTVPELRGLPVGGVNARAKRTHVHPQFSQRYAEVPRGIAMAQAPTPGRRVSYGATVSVILSAGPPPVKVPTLVGLSASSATRLLSEAGLRQALTFVPAPGSTPNLVLRQAPAAAATAPRGATVALTLAETPRWRTLTTFQGVDSGSSVPVRIRGNRWRVSYAMSYRGVCLLLFTCLGPSAQARDLNTGKSAGEFDLGEGNSNTHVFDTGPGLYRVQVDGGTDSAEWSMTVQDYY